jgi:cytochrome c-type biogenesis protein CcmF
MTAEIGHFALVLALALAAIQSLVPLLGARRNDAALMGVADFTAPAQAAFVMLSFVSLVLCYVNSDFSVASVYEN